MPVGDQFSSVGIWRAEGEREASGSGNARARLPLCWQRGPSLSEGNSSFWASEQLLSLHYAVLQGNCLSVSIRCESVPTWTLQSGTGFLYEELYFIGRTVPHGKR